MRPTHRIFTVAMVFAAATVVSNYADAAGHRGGGGGGGGGGFRGGGGAQFRAAAAPSVRPSFAAQSHVGRHDRRWHHRPRYVIPYAPIAVYREPVVTYAYVDWDDCRALKRRALETDSRYWWRKYRECREREDD